MSTLNPVGSALYSKLTGGTALTSLLSTGSAVYSLQAPDNDTLPYVVFSEVSGRPDNITSSDMRNLVYFVRGYSRNQALAGSIDAQISNLLHKGTITVTGYNCLSLLRENDLSSVETPPNQARVYMAGGQYRIRLDD